MARDLLGTPATSTPSERMFSRAGDLYRKKRNRLSGESAQALLNLGAWWDGQGLPGDDAPIFKYRELEQQQTKAIQLPLVKISKGVVSLLAVDGWDKDIIEENSGDCEYASDEDSEDGLLNLDEEITFNPKKGDKVVKIKNVSNAIENDGDMDDLDDDKDDSDELEDGDNSDELEDGDSDESEDGSNDSDELEDGGNDSDRLEDG